MAPSFCRRCGTPLPPGSSFCPACGTPLYGDPGAFYAAGPPPNPWATEGSPVRLGAGRPIGSDPEVDRFALGRVEAAAALGLVGGLISVGLAVANEAVFNVTATGSSAPSPSALFGGLVVLLVISLAIGIAEILLFRSAFVALRDVADAFSTPATLVLIGVIGLALLLPGFVVLVAGLAQVVGCTSSAANGLDSCGVPALLGVGLAVLLLAVVLALLGVIGLLLGIWRLGTRYDDSFFSIGAILLIIPYVSFVGFLLILLAARKARAAR